MRQFQGSLGPIQDLQPKGLPRPAERLKNGSTAAPGGIQSKLRAIVREEKTLIGLANTFGGFLVWVLYVVQQP
jgi:hypothetical protein